MKQKEDFKSQTIDKSTLPENDELEAETVKKTLAPPDGGWGWVVCFACFMTHVLTDGIFYSFGIIFVELLDYYQEDKGSTAVIASLSFGVCLLSGPVNAAMSNYFGYRKTTMFGTVLMSASLICSIFSPNVFCLYITFGIAGWGFGMAYLCSIVCLTTYFEKRRSLAVGLGVSGSGIGTFIFSLLTKALIGRYTWKGAVLIQAGMILNCLACGLVYFPIDHAINRPKRSKMALSGDGSSKESCMEKGCSTVGGQRCNQEDQHGIHELETLIKHEDEHLPEGLTDGVLRISNAKLIAAGGTKLTSDRVTEEGHVSTMDELMETANKDHETNMYSGTRVNKAKKHTGFLDEVVSALKQSFNFNVFRNIPFLLFIVSTVLYSIGYYIPYFYLPDKAELAGIDSYLSAGLVSSIGITNTLGRVIFGFISDKKCINRSVLYSTALIICGLGTVLCTYLNSFGTLLAYTIIFGTFSGVTISLTSVIVADLVGTDLLADAFGVMSFFAGIATFVGPPLAGWLYDETQSYDWSFVSAGITIVLSGAMLYVLPFIKKTETST